MPTKCLKMEYEMVMARWIGDLVGVNETIENG